MIDLNMSDLQVALNPETSPEVLGKLFDEYFYTIDSNESAANYLICTAIASNPNTPLFFLRLLAKGFGNVVANNPVIPFLLVENPLLFNQFAFDELIALLENANFAHRYASLILTQSVNKLICDTHPGYQYLLSHFWSSTMLRAKWNDFVGKLERKIDIDNKRFDNLNFFGVSFINLRFDEVSFYNCTFSGCNFIDCSVNKLDFYLCKFNNVKFTELFMDKNQSANNILFTQCDLSYNKYINNNIPFTFFEQCKLDEFHIKNSFLNESSFTNCRTYNQAIGFKTALKIENTEMFIHDKLPQDILEKLTEKILLEIKSKNYGLNITYS